MITKEDLRVGDNYLLSGTMTIEIVALYVQSFKVVDVLTKQIYYLDYTLSVPRLTPLF